MKIHHAHPLYDTGMLMYIQSAEDIYKHYYYSSFRFPGIPILMVFLLAIYRPVDRRPYRETVYSFIYIRIEYYFSICYRVTADPKQLCGIFMQYPKWTIKNMGMKIKSMDLGANDEEIALMVFPIFTVHICGVKCQMVIYRKTFDITFAGSQTSDEKSALIPSTLYQIKFNSFKQKNSFIQMMPTRTKLMPILIIWYLKQSFNLWV